MCTVDVLGVGFFVIGVPRCPARSNGMSTRNIMKPSSSSSSMPEKSMTASYDELSYCSTATEDENQQDRHGGGDDSSIDSLNDDHPFHLEGRHEPQHYHSVTSTVTNANTWSTRTSSRPPFTTVSPESRRKQLLDMDELVSDDDEDHDDTRNNNKRKTKNNDSSDDLDLDDDLMMIDDIDSNSSASEAHNDDRDEQDDFDDDITDESGDDSDDGGGIKAHHEYPPDTIHPIRKIWKYSCFSETYRRRMDEIPEGDNEDAEAEENKDNDDTKSHLGQEGKEAVEQNKAWSCLDNHQRSWRSQRTVFHNIRMEEGGEATMVLSSPMAGKKHDLLQSLTMEGMVADLSPRSPHERYNKGVHHNVSVNALEVLSPRGSRPQILFDPTNDTDVPVVKILEKKAQNKEAEEEHGLIDSFRAMKRTAFLKTKTKDSSKKAAKKKKKEKDPSKSKPPKTTGGSKTKSKKSKSDDLTVKASNGMTNTDKKVKKKTKVKSTTASEIVTSPSHGSTVVGGGELEEGGALKDLVSSRHKNGSESSVLSAGEAPVQDLVDSIIRPSGAEAPLGAGDLSGHRNKSRRRSSISSTPDATFKEASTTIAPEVLLKEVHRSSHTYQNSRRSSSPVASVDGIDTPTTASTPIALEVTLKDDNRSGQSKSTSPRKSKVEAGESSAATDADVSGRSLSKSRRKLKGDTNHVDHIVDTRSDGKVHNEVSVQSPSKSRRKLKTGMYHEDKPPVSASKSRRRLRVDEAEITRHNDASDHADNPPLGASKSKRNVNVDTSDDDTIEKKEVSDQDKRLSLSVSKSKRNLKVDKDNGISIQQYDGAGRDDRPKLMVSKSKRRLKGDMSGDDVVGQMGKSDKNNRATLSTSNSKRRLKVDMSDDVVAQTSQSDKDNRTTLNASNSKRRLKGETGDFDATEQKDKSDQESRRPRSNSKSKRKPTVHASDDDVIGPYDSRPPFSASNSRRRLKVDTIVDDVIEQKHNGDQDNRPLFSASNSRRRLSVDNSDDDGPELNGTSTTRSSSRSRRKSKSVDTDEMPGKSPSQSKRSIRSKRGSSLRELVSIGATNGVNDWSSPLLKTSIPQPQTSEQIIPQSISEDNEDDDPTTDLPLSLSRTATLRRSISLDHAAYKGISPLGTARLQKGIPDTDTTPLTPSKQKRHSRSRSRSTSRSPKPGKTAAVNHRLSMVDIPTPLTPSERKRHSRSRSRSRSKSPKPGSEFLANKQSSQIEIFGSPELMTNEGSSSDKKRVSSGRSATPEKSGSSGRSETSEKRGGSGRSETPEKRRSSGRSKTPEKRRSGRRSTTPEPLVDLKELAASHDSYHNDDSSSHSSTRKPRSMNRIVDDPESPNSFRKPRSMNHLGEYGKPPKRKKKPGTLLDAVFEQAGLPTKTKR